MKTLSKIIVVSILLMTSQASFAIGVSDVKGFLNGVQFSSSKLNAKNSSLDLVKAEREAVLSRRLAVNNMTGIDRYVNAIQIDQESVSLQIRF